MKQIIPDNKYNGLPCSIVAVSCAKKELVMTSTSHTDGWMTLKDNNKYVRENLDVKKYVYYKRNERPLLKDLHLTGKGIVVVLGHCVYVDREEYYSFFDNENDEVVAVWFLKE